MENFELNYYPEEIAEALVKATETGSNNKADLEDAIYYLKCDAENPYNRDCFRVLYRTLEKLVDAVDMQWM